MVVEYNRPQSIDGRTTAGKPQKPDTSYQLPAISIRPEKPLGGYDEL
jgi:hypothetical protein